MQVLEHSYEIALPALKSFYHDLSKEQLVDRVTQLEFELAQIKRMIFGSKSERFIPVVHPSQSSLFDIPSEEKPEVKEKISYERKKAEKITKDSFGRQILPAHLDRVEIIIEPAENTEGDRKSTRLNSSHIQKSRMPSSA